MSVGASMLRNTLSSVAARLAATVLGVATFAILARTVGPHGLGQYRTALTLVLFAGAIVEFGLYPVMLQGLARDGDERFVGQLIGLRLTSSAVGMLALGLLVQLLEPDPVVRIGVFIAGVGWIGHQLNDVLRALFQQKLARYDSAIAETVGAAVTFALVLSFGVLGYGTDAMLVATAVGLLLTGSVAWRLARRRVHFRPVIDTAAWRQLIIAGLPFAGSALLLTLHFRIDVLLLSILRPSADVGLYDAPAKLYELVFMVPYLLGGVLMPLFVRDLAEPGRLTQRMGAAYGLILLFGALVLGVFLVHAEHITVLLGGPEFVASGQPLRVLGAAAVLGGLCAVLRHAVTAVALERSMVRIDLASVVVAITLHCLLIPRWGIMGAAAGKLGGDFVRTLLTLRLLRAHVTRSFLYWSAGPLLAGGALAALLWGLDQTGIPWIVASAAGGLAVAAACYAVPSVRQALGRLAAG